MEKIKIFVVDDHPVMREGIKTIFSDQPEYVVVGEAEDGLKALEGIAEVKPDVIIMDITLPCLDGIQVIKRIMEDTPDAKVIVFSMHSSREYATDAFRAGAMAYVLKGSGSDELVTAAKKIISGGHYASPPIAEDLLSGFVDMIKKNRKIEPFDYLSSREKEILKLIADGVTSREIAEKLFISVSTVKSHRNNIMKKLKVDDMAGLIKVAIWKGLVKQN